MLYRIKPQFQRVLRPLACRIGALGVRPNQITIGAMLLSLAGGGAIAVWSEQRWPYLVLVGVLLVRMALNALDGELARLRNMKTRLGAALNDLEVVLSDAFIYLPLALSSAVPAQPMSLVLLLVVVAELTAMAPLLSGRQRRLVGPMSKPDRAFAVGALALPLGLGVPSGPWVTAYLAAMAGLLLLTIVNRLRDAARVERPA